MLGLTGHLPARRAAGEALVAVRGLRVDVGRRRLLDGIDLDLEPGRILTLVGPNGSGKTTLVLSLLGLVQPSGGRLTRQPGLHVGYVPQRFRTDPNMPITVRRFLLLSGRGRRSRLQQAVADTGVAGLLDQPLQSVSGGELRRVLLARALLQAPELLVLDEPAAGLDGAGQAEIYRLIRAVRERYGCAVLVVSHDLHLVLAASDQVLCLSEGRILCRGAPESVREHPEYRRLFGSHLPEETAVFPHRHDHGPAAEAPGRRHAR